MFALRRRHPRTNEANPAANSKSERRPWGRSPLDGNNLCREYVREGGRTCKSVAMLVSPASAANSPIFRSRTYSCILSVPRQEWPSQGVTQSVVHEHQPWLSVSSNDHFVEACQWRTDGPSSPTRAARSPLRTSFGWTTSYTVCTCKSMQEGESNLS